MASEVGASPHAPLLVRTTAPLQCLFAFALAAGLQPLLGLPLPPDAMRPALHAAGTVLANAGLALSLWCFVLFATRRTTLMPAYRPARLVRRGPYRLSRNPIYVGLLSSYVGLALMLDVPWALALLPLPMLALQRVIIPFEEARLQTSFGAAYTDYRREVRRWL